MKSLLDNLVALRARIMATDDSDRWKGADTLTEAIEEIEYLQEKVDAAETDAHAQFQALSDAVLDVMDAWGPRAAIYRNPAMARLYALTEGK